MTLDRERWIGDRYLLGACIARGGVGAVHRAVSRDGTEVAIKCVLPEATGDVRLTQSLLDEANLAARIRHPNVVRVLDTIIENDEVFVVMELVEGRNLRALLGEKPPPRVAAGIVAQALSGLHAAHETKSESGESFDIVHRDVSPSNILVARDGMVKVTDFGVAKARQRLQYTRTGEVKGKLGYLSFEQLNEMKLDRRTDVFSASVVLWELLTTQRLFDGGTELEIMTQVLSGVPDAPSRRNPLVPAELDAITERGLARRADERFQSALEMERALRESGQAAEPPEIAEWLRGLEPANRPATTRRFRPSLVWVLPASLFIIVLVALLLRTLTNR